MNGRAAPAERHLALVAAARVAGAVRARVAGVAAADETGNRAVVGRGVMARLGGLGHLAREERVLLMGGAVTLGEHPSRFRRYTGGTPVGNVPRLLSRRVGMPSWMRGLSRKRPPRGLI